MLPVWGDEVFHLPAHVGDSAGGVGGVRVGDVEEDVARGEADRGGSAADGDDAGSGLGVSAGRRGFGQAIEEED